MRYAVSFFAILITLSCGKPEPKPDSIQFDKIEHFHLDISEEEAIDLINSENKKEVQLGRIISQDLPSGLNDRSSIDLLESRYKRTKIPVSLHSGFVDCFGYESLHHDYAAAACIPFYRDIFILYNRQKISGIIKICLECGKQEWIGMEWFHDTYYIDTDFAKLGKMFSPKRANAVNAIGHPQK